MGRWERWQGGAAGATGGLRRCPAPMASRPHGHEELRAAKLCKGWATTGHEGLTMVSAPPKQRTSPARVAGAGCRRQSGDPPRPCNRELPVQELLTWGGGMEGPVEVWSQAMTGEKTLKDRGVSG